jgi:hypothetical protein
MSDTDKKTDDQKFNKTLKRMLNTPPELDDKKVRGKSKRKARKRTKKMADKEFRWWDGKSRSIPHQSAISVYQTTLHFSRLITAFLAAMRAHYHYSPNLRAFLLFR